MSRLDPLTWSGSARYPDHAGHIHGSRTSLAGARRIEPRRESLEDVVRSLLVIAGENGLTDFELQTRAEAEGIRSLMRPRRATLLARGEIVDSGRTRPGSKGRAMSVWVLA